MPCLLLYDAIFLFYFFSLFLLVHRFAIKYVVIPAIFRSIGIVIALKKIIARIKKRERIKTRSNKRKKRIYVCKSKKNVEMKRVQGNSKRNRNRNSILKDTDSICVLIIKMQKILIN